MVKEDRVAEFKQHMQEEFAKIPKNLSIEEYLDRSDRCMSLSDTFRQEGDALKSKKYELLSRKYKQLVEDKRNPKPKVVPQASAQVIIDQTPAETAEDKKEGFFSKCWSKLFGSKKEEAKTEELKEVEAAVVS